MESVPRNLACRWFERVNFALLPKALRTWDSVEQGCESGVPFQALSGAIEPTSARRPSLVVGSSNRSSFRRPSCSPITIK